MSSKHTFLKKTLWLVLILYILSYGVVYFFQRKFIFHPKKVEPKANIESDFFYIEKWIKWNNDKDSFPVLIFKTNDTPKGNVVFLHGNQDNVYNYLSYTKEFINRGYNLFMPEYPGFGKASSEPATFNLETAMLKMQEEFGFDSTTIIYGKSLGTGIASKLAANNRYKMLILETPYNHIKNIFDQFTILLPNKLLLKDSLNTINYIPKVEEPITIMHGKNDGVIHYNNAAQLKPLLKNTDCFYTFEKGTHHNLRSFNLYKSILDSLLK